MTRQRFQAIRRSLLTAGVMASMLAATFSIAAADAFPTGPVKIIIPFPPGGPTDTVGRQIAQRLEGIWQQPVIIDYKPGAGTAIGADYVAKAPADGQTIGIVNSSFAVNASLRKNLPYDTLKDLVGITQIANLELAIVARADALFNTLPELIAYAKKNPASSTTARLALAAPHTWGLSCCSAKRASPCCTYPTRAARPRIPS